MYIAVYTHVTVCMRVDSCESVWNGNYANKSDLETGHVNKEESRQMAGQASYVQFRCVNSIYLHASAV